MKVRAKIKGRKVVEGWYCYSKKQDQHFIIQCDDGLSLGPNILYFWGTAENSWFCVIKIDISTAAVETGKLDKHDKMIWGSKGQMQGGDKVRIHSKDKLEEIDFDAEWNERVSAWVFQQEGGVMSRFCSWNSDELEIIS